VEDDQRSVIENSSMSRYFTMQEEEFFKIGVVSFKCLATLLRQGVEGRLDDVILVDVGFCWCRSFHPSCLTCVK
jgi:hypothetical protein